MYAYLEGLYAKLYLFLYLLSESISVLSTYPPLLCERIGLYRYAIEPIHLF